MVDRKQPLIPDFSDFFFLERVFDPVPGGQSSPMVCPSSNSIPYLDGIVNLKWKISQKRLFQDFSRNVPNSVAIVYQ